MAFDIDAALRYVVEREGSDLHVKVASPPMARIHGALKPIEGAETLTAEDTQAGARAHPRRRRAAPGVR
jgi:Tfp pilus assembly pilus retraction ATPase PilT